MFVKQHWDMLDTHWLQVGIFFFVEKSAMSLVSMLDAEAITAQLKT